MLSRVLNAGRSIGDEPCVISMLVRMAVQGIALGKVERVLAQTQPSEPAHPEQKGWLWEELGRLKGLALGALMGVVRDMAARGLPGTLGHRIAEEVDHLNSHLGGETIRGSLFSNEK